MKSIYSIGLLAICTLLLTACPVSTTYPLGRKGEVKADQSLIGAWKTTAQDVEASAVTITKGKEANTYSVHVSEKGSMFMAESTEFTGWLAKIDDRTFLVLQEIIEGTATETYYMYHIRFDGDKLITNDITLKVGGTDAITSVDSYREEVKASMVQEGFLASEIVWTK